MAGSKTHFSGRHELYGYKVKVLVLLIGVYIRYTKCFSSSVLDLEMYRQNHKFRSDTFKNVASELDILDERRLPNR